MWQDTIRWCKRHLNWTVVLVPALLAFVIPLVFIPIFLLLGSPDDGLEGALWLIRALVYLIAIIVVGSWALRQKKRSLWWLWLVIPFGWLPYVCLKNRGGSTISILAPQTPTPQQQMQNPHVYQQPQQKQGAGQIDHIDTSPRTSRDRLYRMISRAKPEILWQAENRQESRERKKLEKQGTKLIRVRLAYHWEHYDRLDTFQRQALEDYIATQERELPLADLLWEQGYRHGDHVLAYNPFEGSFKERVIEKFYDKPSLMSPDMIIKFEETQGTQVKPGDRTQRKQQPDLKSHETGWLIDSR